MQKRFIVLFLVACTLMIALVFLPFSWTNLSPEICGIQNCYCEPFRPGFFVLQPITALSNLGYILFGLVVLSFGASHGKQRNPMNDQPLWISAYGVALNLTGWFSFFSHSSLTRLGEWFDLMGVYLLIGLLLVYTLKRWKAVLAPIKLAAIYALIQVIFGAQMVIAPKLQQICIAVLLLATGLLEVATRLRQKPQGQNRYFAAALICFALGGAIWGSFGRAPMCQPGNFPWHIGWHLLSAVAAYLLFLYYRSEVFQRTGQGITD